MPHVRSVGGGRRFDRLHIQPVGGVAGDMLLAALLGLGASEGAVRRALASAGLARDVLHVEQVEVMGERARSVRSIEPTDEPVHRHLSDILAVIDRAATSPTAKALAR